MKAADGKLPLCAAVDRTSTYGFVRLTRKTATGEAWMFFHELIEAIPYQIHTVLTGKGIQFTNPPKSREGPRQMVQPSV